MRILRAPFFALALFPIGALLAQPVINPRVPAVSSASYRTAGLDGSGIAQGSIFSIFGTGLGPGTWTPANAFPLETSLAGVSVSVTTGSTQTDAIILGTNSTQINAIMPSTTPTGTGTFTVTYNNQTSAPAPIQVVSAAFGIYTYTSSGSGQAIATDTNYVLNTIIHTFHPGDYVTLWGTGLGAINASDAEPPPAGNLPVAIKVHVGDQTASIAYQGRAPCCAGLDQIDFVVPPGINGCYVPVGVEIGGVTGSVATIAVSASGQTCTDSIMGQDLVNKLASGQKVDFGYVRLESSITKLLGPSGVYGQWDYGFATFSEFYPGSAGLAEYGISSGYCYVVNCSSGCASNGATWNYVLSDSSPAQLDAGALAVTYGYAVPLSEYAPGGFYAGNLRTTGNRFLWSGLTYGVSGAGGAGVQAFSTTDTASIESLQFSNILGNPVVPRSSDFKVQWTGGDPTMQNGQVTIGGLSSNADFTQFEIFQCVAPLAAQQFTIPAWILSGMPVSGTGNTGTVSYPLGLIWLGQYNKPTEFSAPGLDRGIVTDIFYYGAGVYFQ